MNSNYTPPPLDLLALNNTPAIKQISGFCRYAEQLDPTELITAYRRVFESAPRRHERNKHYFVGHSGVTSSGSYSNRREEHLAVALWNRCNDGNLLALPDGRTLKLLDYQFPLKARQGDKGVGKVDLFGLIGDDTPCVIELKIHAAGKGMGDTPLRAFLEALAYCAIVDANISDITEEASSKFGHRLLGRPPNLMVMAPREYWTAYLDHKRTGDWWPVLLELAEQLEKTIGLKSHFIALNDSDFTMGLEGQKPQLAGNCSLSELKNLVDRHQVSSPLEVKSPMSFRNSGQGYLDTLVQRFWDFSEPGLLPALESDQRVTRRPPVFRKEYAVQNILFPPHADAEQRSTIESTLPIRERHRWFRSMKSSQAVAQSVFGNLVANGDLRILQGLETDEGLPAFCDDIGSAKSQLEYSVKHLGEPRPTSVDFWVDGSRRIAVECKLTEQDFGTCSRPRLTQARDSNYHRDYCTGSYTRQMGRHSRCSLSEIGVRYWDYIPELFDWNTDLDLEPCPLSSTYQLVRNILAACVMPDGRIDTRNAHGLIIYDARNPSFQSGGVADTQWKAVKSALKSPELVRSCSWQSLVEHISRSSEQSWLVEQLKAKYGF